MKESPINSGNLIEHLRAHFPEIEERYQVDIGRWKDDQPGNYTIVGFVFKPRVKEELDKGEMTNFLKRFATFMELVCESGDVEAINVIWLKLFKLLLARPVDLGRLWPILGPLTKANIQDAAKRWKLIRNLPVSGMLGILGHHLFSL